jgi:two-component system response regulator AtoC
MTPLVTDAEPLVAELRDEIGTLRRALARAGGPLAGLVGRSHPMQQLFSAILAAAERREPVLVFGESGAGKSAVAAALHRLSPRGRETMRTFAFDGRLDAPDAGEIAAAASSAGALIVEGVPHAPREMQRALLDATRHPAGARLILVSPRDPAAAVHDGRLDSDLARVSRTIGVPPLRERREDIPALVEYFLRPSDASPPAPALDPKALEAMRVHEWTGNVRELRNVIRRARALSDGATLGLAAIQSMLGGASARTERDGDASGDRDIVAVRVGDSMADIERRVLQRTLRFAQGNKRKAAEMLELSLKTIYNKVKEYGLEREFNRRFRKEPRSE